MLVRIPLPVVSVVVKAVVVTAMEVADKGDVVAVVKLEEVGRTWTVEDNWHVWRKSLLHCWPVLAVCGGMVAGSVDGGTDRWRVRTGK